jgi:putative aminopeptidase FrvX
MYENVYNNETLKIFTDLLSVPSPTGREELIAAKIMEYAKKFGYEPELDYTGNVLVRVKGNGKSKHVTMTASHIDEIGLVITNIEKDGKLKIHKLGGMLPWKIGERPVMILTDKRDYVTGIVSFGSGHSMVGMNTVDWNMVRLETGLSVEQLKERGVRVGSVAVPIREHVGPIVFGDEKDPMIGAWTYDDRMGCAFQLSILKAMKEDGVVPNCDWLFAFVKQEEVKGNGIKPLTFTEKPDVLITIDGGAIFHGSDMTLDGGCGMLTKDKLADYSFDVILAIQEAAKAVGQELQYGVTEAAYTDASLALQAGTVKRIGHFGYTKANSHGFELMKASMLKQYFELFYSFVKTFVP